MDRIEVITSVERRRKHSLAEKEREAKAAAAPGANVVEIAGGRRRPEPSLSVAKSAFGGSIDVDRARHARHADFRSRDDFAARQLLANVYLHYVFDLWTHRWRRRDAMGDVTVVRYADDSVVGFEFAEDARAFLDGLRKRLGQFGFSLNEAGTRTLEFGRYAIERRARRGQRRPETFDFLGFTHICGQRRKTRSFIVRRLTVAKRLRATLKAIRVTLMQRDGMGQSNRRAYGFAELCRAT